MNKQRRKELDLMSTKLNNIIRSDNLINELNAIQEIINDLEDIKFDEEYYMDNIPENLQGGRYYDIAEEAYDNIEEALDWLNDIDRTEGNIEKIIECIQKAIGFINDASM